MLHAAKQILDNGKYLIKIEPASRLRKKALAAVKKIEII